MISKKFRFVFIDFGYGVVGGSVANDFELA
jgi:hypothetical protein